MTRPAVLRRRARPAVEPLERRDLLAGIPFNFTLGDPLDGLLFVGRGRTRRAAVDAAFGGAVSGRPQVRGEVIGPQKERRGEPSFSPSSRAYQPKPETTALPVESLAPGSNAAF